MVRSFLLSLVVVPVEAGRFLKHHQRLTMESVAPYYHSSDAIHQEITDLATKCPAMKLETKTDESGNLAIDVVTIRDPESQPINKNFLLFGEHARELVSPESGLHFIKTLCGQTGLSDRAKEVLKDNEFQIIVNGNPHSRKKVEQGEFCLRVNENGVDLNRNWDEEWQPDAADGVSSVDTNPGPAPFSEPETKIFKAAVAEYQPTTFLTVHSGTKGMYMPWAYDMDHLAKRNQPEMMQILKTLDKNHCQCPFGAAGREVGYSCPGTCLDYVYDKLNVEYAFAWEIYTNPEMDGMLQDRWQEKMNEQGSFLQLTSHLGHEHFKDLFEDHPSSFVQLRASRGHDMSPEECFSQFNPASESELNSVVENWSGAYMDMAQEVAIRIRGKTQQATPSTTAPVIPIAPAAVVAEGDSASPKTAMAAARANRHITDEEQTPAAPEQGFEGEDVQHESGKTQTDDWGQEYGEESDRAKEGAQAKEVEEAEDSAVQMHQDKAAFTTTTPLPEQGFSGPLVEHKDGETKTDDWRREYGPKGPQKEDGPDGPQTAKKRERSETATLFSERSEMAKLFGKTGQ